MAAAAAGSARLLLHVPPQYVLLLIAVLTAGLVLATFGKGGFALAAKSIGTRTHLKLHLVRFVGFYFLFLQSRGRLPPEFAQPAGWGDAIAAAGALALLVLPEGALFDQLLAPWNALGLLDLVVAVSSAGWMNLTRPGSMNEMAGLPMALVPLWLVPFLVASHLLLFRQMRNGPAKEP